MAEETVTELQRLVAPWGKEVVVQEVTWDNGFRLLRLRIREGKRFTMLDVDVDTAESWAALFADWATRTRPLLPPSIEEENGDPD